jgi:type III restriction enzyme
MIINTQAFNTSLKEGAKNKEARIIYSLRDDFNTRRPIDVIAANQPIIIMDEPTENGGCRHAKGTAQFPSALCAQLLGHTQDLAQLYLCSGRLWMLIAKSW